MSGTERGLFYLNFAAELVLLWRLLHIKLYRIYFPLFWYWALQALGSVALFSVGMNTFQYLYVYWVVQTINILMAVFVVQDLYRMALLDHPALSSVARRSMLMVMTVAAVLALSGLALDVTIPRGQFPAIHRFATFERSMNFLTLLFLLIVSALLMWFPIRIRRNIVVYISGFVLFSASRSFGVLVANLLPPRDTRFVRTVLLALTLTSLAIWIAGLSPEGEMLTATPGYRRNPERMQRLGHQLDSINGALNKLLRH